MKKIIKLTETDLTRIVKQILKESVGGFYYAGTIDLGEEKNKGMLDKVKGEEFPWADYDSFTGEDDVKIIYPYKYGNGLSKVQVEDQIKSFVNQSNQICKISERVPVYLITREEKKTSRENIKQFFPPKPFLKYTKKSLQEIQEILSNSKSKITVESVGTNLYMFEGKKSCEYLNLFTCGSAVSQFMCLLESNTQ